MPNASLLSRFVMVTIVLFQIVQSIEAQRFCRNSQSCKDGYRCCVVGRELLCCRNTFRFWSQWYIWFGVVMFFLLLFSCLVAYRRRQRLRYQRSSAAVAAAVAQSRGTMHQFNLPGQMTQHANTPVITDAPPSYDELKIQGISSQFQAFQEKDEEASPSVPVPSYNQAVAQSAPPYHEVAEPEDPPPKITTTTRIDPPAPPYPDV